MEPFLWGGCAGILVASLYFQLWRVPKIIGEVRSVAYFSGWVDRHKAKPLLPRYWKHIRFFDYFGDPVEQMQERNLSGRPGGSYEERLAASVPPMYSVDTGMELAVSDAALKMLQAPEEMKWRGVADIELPIRRPWAPHPKDVSVLLSMGFSSKEIGQYYAVENLKTERNWRGRIVKVNWDHRS